MTPEQYAEAMKRLEELRQQVDDYIAKWVRGSA